MQNTLKHTLRTLAMLSPRFNSGEDWQSISWKTPLVDTGTGEGQVWVQGQEWSCTSSLLNLHSPENGFQVRASGIKSGSNISIIDAPNDPNRLAYTVNFGKEDFQVLIALMFMF